MIWLVACGLFQNQPPVLESFDGVPYDVNNGFRGHEADAAFQFTPGTDYAVSITAKDPENDGIQVWWPEAPDGWDFPPTARKGVWHVPADLDVTLLSQYPMSLLLMDTNKGDPRGQSFQIPLYEPGTTPDTGTGHHGF